MEYRRGAENVRICATYFLEIIICRTARSNSSRICRIHFITSFFKVKYDLNNREDYLLCLSVALSLKMAIMKSRPCRTKRKTTPLSFSRTMEIHK